MTDSILTSTKKVLGFDAAYTVFDPDLILHINTALSTLNQLGIGPDDGFMIEDASATWSAFLGGNKKLNGVKTYVFLRVRYLFDPPGTSFLMTAMQEQIRELEWRLNVVRESNDWIDGNVVDPGTVFRQVAGMPVHKRIRVKDGMDVWASLDLFETKMIVSADSSGLRFMQDLSSYLSVAYDGNDIVIDWAMTGAQTRTLSSGHYNVILSDIGPNDATAITALTGYLEVKE